MATDDLIIDVSARGIARTKAKLATLSAQTDMMSRRMTASMTGMRGLTEGLASKFGSGAAKAAKLARGLGAVGAAAGTAVAAVGALGAAILKVGEGGQKVSVVSEQFAKLGGTAADMRKLKDATKGELGATKLKQLANQARQVGVSQDSLIRVLQAARVTSKRTGKSFETLAEKGMDGLQRGSVMLLDDISEMGKASDAYAQKAKEMGVSVKELTGEQKRASIEAMFLANSTAQAAASQEMAGSAYAQSRASVTDLVDEFKVLVSQGVATSGALDAIKGAIKTVGTLMSENKETIKALVNDAMTLFVSVGKTLGGILMGWLPALKSVMGVFSSLMGVVGALAPVFGALTNVVLTVMAAALHPLMMVLGSIISVIGDAAEAIGLEGLGKSLQEAGDRMAEVGKITKETTETTKDTAKAAEEAAESEKKLGDSLKGTKKKAKERNKELVKRQKHLFGLVKMQHDVKVSDEQLLKGKKAEIQTAKEARRMFANLKQDYEDLHTAAGRQAAAEAIVNQVFRETGGDGEAAAKALNLISKNMDIAASKGGGLLQVFGGLSKNAAFNLLTGRGADPEARERSLSAQTEALKGQRDLQARITKELQKRRKVEGDDGVGEERRRLIMEAELVGLDDRSATILEAKRQLTENLKLSGGDKAAIAASHKIFAAELGEITLTDYALVGEMAMDGFIAGFRRASPGGGPLRQLFAGAQEIATGQGLQIGAAMLDGWTQAWADPDVQMTMMLQQTWRDLGESSLLLAEAMAPLNQQIQQMRQGMGGEEGVNVAARQFLTIVGQVEEVTLAAGSAVRSVMGALDNYAAANRQAESGAISLAEAERMKTQAIMQGVGGGINAVQQGTLAFVRSQRKRATIMGAMEAARAAAAYATGNIIGGVAHTLAAAKFFAIGAGALGRTKPQAGGGTSSRDSRQRTELTRSRALLDRRDRGQRVINQNFFSALDGRDTGEMIIEAQNASSRRNTGARLSSDLIGTGNIHGGL